MQNDFHYYGTYALARLAGLNAEQAKRIATSAQFVDDASEEATVEHPEGARFSIEPTGHKLSQLEELNDHDDQIRVWVPFHFLPGGEGVDLTRRLICWPDSKVANAVMDFAIAQVSKPFGMEAIGVAAHAYADTFAHHGFSGVSSRLNRVAGNTVKMQNGGEFLEPVEEFLKNHPFEAGLLQNFRLNVIASRGAEIVTGALGHGGVATCPDAPYLEWSYSYERPDLWGTGAEVRRSNPENYMHACKRMHEQFTRIGAGKVTPFTEFSAVLERVIVTPGDASKRAERWRQAAGLRELPIEEIPAYEGNTWMTSMRGWKYLGRPELVQDDAAYRFLQAATCYRSFVLRDLLPHNNICLT